MEKITIIVIDDHPLFRQGVVDTLALYPDFDVVGQSSSGRLGLELIRDLMPQVGIVDVNLPYMNGHQLTQAVLLEKLPTRIILLTAYDDLEQKIVAFQVGAFAYCNKFVLPDMLVDTVRNVADGKYCMENQVLDSLDVQFWLAQQKAGDFGKTDDGSDVVQPLSVREMEVLSYVTRGMSNKQIATTLDISQQTVKNHITTILRKLSVEDRTSAAIYAIRRGWVRVYPGEIDQE